MLFPSISIVSAQQTRPKVVRYNLYELPTAKAAARKLSKEVLFAWEDKPLREGLMELAQTHSISIWLDRRIDPNQFVRFVVKATAADRSLGSALSQLAATVQAEAGLVENVVYIGPASEVSKVQRAAVTLHDSISVASENGNAEMRGLHWPELSTPNGILRDVETQWEIKVSADLPHDLLHAGQLAGPCTLATQLSIVLGGFNREARFTQAGQYAVAPLGNAAVWQCTYDKSTLNAVALETDELTGLKREFPGSTLRWQGSKCTVAGVTGFHLALLQPAVPKVPPAKREKEIMAGPWGFEIKNKPADQVIQFMARSIGLDVTWDPAFTEAQRTKLVSFRLTNASLDEVLQAFGEASEMFVVREGLGITLQPRR